MHPIALGDGAQAFSLDALKSFLLLVVVQLTNERNEPRNLVGCSTGNLGISETVADRILSPSNRGFSQRRSIQSLPVRYPLCCRRAILDGHPAGQTTTALSMARRANAPSAAANRFTPLDASVDMAEMSAKSSS